MNNLQQYLGYKFHDIRLLAQALTHRSYSSAHNERLEFLGDSVLSLSIASQLFQSLPQASEGDLSRIRSHLVREGTLHQLALELGLNKALRLGEGELRSGGSERASILADALEAIIGAIYLDGGFAMADAFVQRVFAAELKGQPTSAVNWRKDAKTALQEWLQSGHMELPLYTVSATHGALHDQTFEVLCTALHLGVSATGQGASRRLAEQNAAQKVLELLIKQYGATPKKHKKQNKVSIQIKSSKKAGDGSV